MSRVLIAAGGTGGHVYPALALADALRDRGHDISFCGGDRVEARLVPEAGYILHRLPGRGLPRSLSPGALAAGLDLGRALWSSRRLVRGFEVVVGMGGYPSLAPSLAAGWRGVPVVLHEQNARLSLAHRLSLRRARVLALSLPLADPEPRRVRVVTTGNPLRPAIRDLARADTGERDRRRHAARERFDLDPDRRTILVFGGSLGASALNETVPRVAGRWPGDVQVLHVSGPDHADAAREAWAGSEARAVVRPYVDDMDDAYAVADLAICRSGASTVSELTAVGLASVLVPFPHAPGRAQDANAMTLSRAGAAQMVPQDPPAGFADRLAGVVDRLLRPPERLSAMGRAARDLGHPGAADRLADLVEATAT